MAIVNSESYYNKSQSDMGIFSHLIFTFESPKQTLNKKYEHKHIKTVYSRESNSYTDYPYIISFPIYVKLRFCKKYAYFLSFGQSF